MRSKKNNNENLNRNLTVGSLIVIAVVGLYFIFGQSAPQAEAQADVQTEIEQVAQEVLPQEAPVEESLGASSSGLGR